nr:polyprenyl synthetase family protein [Corynebacterium auriscanis]
MRTQGNAFANSFDTPDDWALDSPLNAVPAAVNRRLNQYLAASQLEFLEINPLVTQAIETMGDFIVNGGKRVRPTFAWAGVRAGLDEAKATTAGGRQPLTTSGNDAQDPDALANSFLSAISAFEFIQACALIHDDIVDQSNTRRGNPTVHRVFEGHHRQREWWGESAHYGTSQAILTGDLALAWADDLLWDSGLSLRGSTNAAVPGGQCALKSSVGRSSISPWKPVVQKTWTTRGPSLNTKPPVTRSLAPCT